MHGMSLAMGVSAQGDYLEGDGGQIKIKYGFCFL